MTITGKGEVYYATDGAGRRCVRLAADRWYFVQEHLQRATADDERLLEEVFRQIMKIMTDNGPADAWHYGSSPDHKRVVFAAWPGVVGLARCPSGRWENVDGTTKYFGDARPYAWKEMAYPDPPAAGADRAEALEKGLREVMNWLTGGIHPVTRLDLHEKLEALLEDKHD